MIPVANPIPKPALFDENCRRPGLQWLRINRTSKKFPSHWREFQPDLAEGFHNRCGWWAMRIADGAVDHYLSKENHRRLAYSWNNYRYIAGTVNSSKKKRDDTMLDPFEVQPGWFEVQLPSMQLIRTDQVPQDLRAKADFTLTKLHLRNGIKVRRNRKRWYDDYKANKVTRDGLRDYAPLIAAAVERLEANHQPLP